MYQTIQAFRLIAGFKLWSKMSNAASVSKQGPANKAILKAEVAERNLIRFVTAISFIVNLISTISISALFSVFEYETGRDTGLIRYVVIYFPIIIVMLIWWIVTQRIRLLADLSAEAARATPNNPLSESDIK